MTHADTKPGFPNGQAPRKRRKQKQTPSRRRAEAERLKNRIETLADERHEAWAEGAHPNVIARLTQELIGRPDTFDAGQLGKKRAMRREIYREAARIGVKLEGDAFYRGTPGGRA